MGRKKEGVSKRALYFSQWLRGYRNKVERKKISEFCYFLPLFQCCTHEGTSLEPDDNLNSPCHCRANSTLFVCNLPLTQSRLLFPASVCTSPEREAIKLQDEGQKDALRVVRTSCYKQHSPMGRWKEVRQWSRVPPGNAWREDSWGCSWAML